MYEEEEILILVFVTCMCVCVWGGGWKVGVAWGLRLCVLVCWEGGAFSSLLYRVKLFLSKGG